MNYNYVKIINQETIQYAPRVLVYNNRTYCNPPERIYNVVGYYKITRAEYPDDGQNYVANYTYNPTTNRVEESWELVIE